MELASGELPLLPVLATLFVGVECLRYSRSAGLILRACREREMG